MSTRARPSPAKQPAPRRPPRHTKAARATVRGGARPGAGAPPGNLNALKLGARSKYVQNAVRALLADELTAELFVALLTAVMGDRRRTRLHLTRAMVHAGRSS